MGFRATLNYRKFKVALSPMCRIWLNVDKSCILASLLKCWNKKTCNRAASEMWALETEIKSDFSRS